MVWHSPTAQPFLPANKPSKQTFPGKGSTRAFTKPGPKGTAPAEITGDVWSGGWRHKCDSFCSTSKCSCLPWFIQHFSLLAGWGAGLDLPRVSTRTGITFPKAVLGCCAENQVKQTQPVFHTDCWYIWEEEAVSAYADVFLEILSCSLWFALALFCSDLAECQWGLQSFTGSESAAPQAPNKAGEGWWGHK